MQKQEESRLKVNGQWLMSYSTALYDLGDLFAARLVSLDNLSEDDLLVLLDSLSYCRTQLMERLTLEHGTFEGGSVCVC